MTKIPRYMTGEPLPPEELKKLPRYKVRLYEFALRQRAREASELSNPMGAPSGPERRPAATKRANATDLERLQENRKKEVEELMKGPIDWGST